MENILSRLKPLVYVASLIALAWGCSDDKNAALTPQQKQANAQAAAQDNTTMIAASQEAMDATVLAFADQGLVGGRTANDAQYWGGCKPQISGSFNVDNSLPDSIIYSGTITLDYGDGTTCSDSVHHRSGKISDTFVYSISTKNMFVFSSMETIEFTGFHRDTTTLDGTIIVKSATHTPTSVEAQGTKLTYADGTSASWSGTLLFEHEKQNQCRDWHGGKNIKITGALTGNSRTGANFTATITQAIVFTNTCGHRHRFIPVSGLIDLVTDGITSTIDFGDGSCDKEFTVTSNGVVETRTWDKGVL